MNRVNQQIGFILKSQSFKETSSIHQVFTRDYGVISIISKGSRVKNSKYGSLLQPFKSLLLSWVGKSELKTLTGVDEHLQIQQLKGTSLYCGFYVNELILNLIHKHDAHLSFFNSYEQAIRKLSEVDQLEACLREFEKLLFDNIGYGLSLEYDADSHEPIQAGEQYRYIPGHGAVRYNSNSQDAILGSTLINLRLNQLNGKTELMQAKHMMRRLIDTQLDGKILKSRDLFV